MAGEQVQDRDGAKVGGEEVREATASAKIADTRSLIKEAFPAVRKNARGVAGLCTENESQGG